MRATALHVARACLPAFHNSYRASLPQATLQHSYSDQQTSATHEAYVPDQWWGVTKSHKVLG